MTKRLIMILALAFVVGIAFSAYAEVQNVKVSGDLLMRAVSRNDFTLLKDYKYKVGGLMSTLRVRIDADLTDNVSTTVRLLNERSWGSDFSSTDLSEEGGNGRLIAKIFGAGPGIDVDLAYVTLKEFLYSPLTLTVGRQELRFGNGLIIGDVDSNILAINPGVPFDLSARKAFDAMRATLSYDPLVIDLIYAKVSEHDLWWAPRKGSEKNDTDLYGVNIASDLKDLGITGKGELYYFGRINKYPVYNDDTGKKDTCNTIGMLVSAKIKDNLTGSLEYAYQFGKAISEDESYNRSAFALQAILGYNFQTNYAPNLSLGYTYLSGDKDTSDNKCRLWDPMFEDQTPNNIVNAIFPNTGVQAFNIMGSLKPKEDLTLAANFGYYLLAQKIEGDFIPSVYGDFGIDSSHTAMGTALDLTATYDYTEDVQLGLTFGMFSPGKALKDSNNLDVYDRTATQLIGSMKVTF